MEAFDRGIFVRSESRSRKRCGRARNVGFTRRWYAKSVEGADQLPDDRLCFLSDAFIETREPAHKEQRKTLRGRTRDGPR